MSSARRTDFGVTRTLRRPDSARRVLWLPACFIALIGIYGHTQSERAPLSGEDALLEALVFDPLTLFESRLYPADVRGELDRFTERARRNLHPAVASTTGIAALAEQARRRYAARLAAVADDDAWSLAVAYTDALQPCYEWEGLHDCPEREAIYADRYQAAHPDGPFRSYLPLFAAHRWLCAAEAYDFEKNSEQAARSRAHHRQRMVAALASDSAMVRYAAGRLSARATCFAPRPA